MVHGRRSNTIKQLMNILIICSIPTMFFGYLYGEFFGKSRANDGLDTACNDKWDDIR